MIVLAAIFLGTLLLFAGPVWLLLRKQAEEARPPDTVELTVAPGVYLHNGQLITFEGGKIDVAHVTWQQLDPDILEAHEQGSMSDDQMQRLLQSTAVREDKTGMH